jgi:hypothetical protein
MLNPCSGSFMLIELGIVTASQVFMLQCFVYGRTKRFSEIHVCIDMGQAVTNNRYSNFGKFLFNVVNLILFCSFFCGLFYYTYCFRLYNVSCRVIDE